MSMIGLSFLVKQKQQHHSPVPTVLNFAEQVGSGAVTVVWLFLSEQNTLIHIKLLNVGSGYVLDGSWICYS